MNLLSSMAAEDVDEDEPPITTRQLVQLENKKKRKSGGFQSMGLSNAVFRGIMKKGYKVPTPIQRKTIPVLLEGRDVVAMARTGSGKSAAFLIPLLEALRARDSANGPRALLLSPSRELAIQTLKFFKELGRYTDLRASLITGGDSLDGQFSSLHDNPDVVIATPGRLCHVLVEMSAKLSHVRYIVIDEADRLFEMGFAEQLTEILKRIPRDDRQMMLFSATLPKDLVEFAKAGLSNPTLIRLDVETKISELLSLSFFHTRPEDKPPLLVRTLRDKVQEGALTLVFVSTKHHVEYLHRLLEKAGLQSTYLYSSLDPTARKINTAKFRSRQVPLLLVTDVAARGIDIPFLDCVINYDFPPKPKLFVHRVGRVARAGRTGAAFSFVTPEEVPFLLDLHLFLGRPLSASPYGAVPPAALHFEREALDLWLKEDAELEAMVKVVGNAMKKYLRSRPRPSIESVKRARKMPPPDIHPEWVKEAPEWDTLQQIRAYRPRATVFEVMAKKNKRGVEVFGGDAAQKMMKVKRMKDQRKIKGPADLAPSSESTEARMPPGGPLCEISEEEIQRTFSDVIVQHKPDDGSFRPPKRLQADGVDERHFVPFAPKDRDTEKGLAVTSEFDREAKSAGFDLVGDDEEAMRQKTQAKKWDRKRKRFVGPSGNEDPKKKKIRTENGTWVSASYRTGRYDQWRKRQGGALVDGGSLPTGSGRLAGRRGGGEGQKRELRNVDEITKQRRVKKKHEVMRNRKNRRKEGEAGGASARGRRGRR